MSGTPETDRNCFPLGGQSDASHFVWADFARRLERERDEAELKRREIYNQLHRVCLEAFDMDDTIGGEPFDDYLLRKIGWLKETKAALIKSLELLVIASGSCPPTSAMIEALRTVNDTCGDLITRAKGAK